MNVEGSTREVVSYNIWVARTGVALTAQREASRAEASREHSSISERRSP